MFSTTAAYLIILTATSTHTIEFHNYRACRVAQSTLESTMRVEADPIKIVTACVNKKDHNESWW